MTQDQLDTFLRETRIAKITYLEPDGMPMVVPVWFEWDGSVARAFTTRGSRKAKRLAEDPRVVLSCEEPVGVPERWVTIQGVCSFADEGTMPLIERLTRRYYEPAKAEEELRSWTANPDMWVTLVVTPTKVWSGT